VPRADGGTAVLHASCVLWRGRGILVRGRSGSGKSTLVLRLLEAGAWLVADDLVRLRAREGMLVAEAPQPRGHLEVRGLGLFRLVSLPRCRVHLVVRATAVRGERLPEPAAATICGVRLPEVTVDPGAPAAAARLGLALFAVRIA
jgi:serine kinase of HPr protein (carbohydrate metabolism regulator)